MATVIDLEFFFEAPNKPIVKEVAICSSTGGVESEVFLPPFAWFRLPSATRRNNAWIERQLNGFRWTDGERPYGELRQFLQDRVVGQVFAKGLQKCEFLATLLNVPVTNLEEMECPKAFELFTGPTQCPHAMLFPKHGGMSCCAVKKCHAFYLWLVENK